MVTNNKALARRGAGGKDITAIADANRSVTEITGLARRVRNATAAYALTGSGLAAIGNFIFPTGLDYNGNGGWNGALGGFLSVAPADFDYSQVDPSQSSVVMACLNWIIRTFKEAKPGVYRQNADGQFEIVPNHKAARLITRPNRFYSYSKLVGALLLDYHIGGNAYVFKGKPGEDGSGTTDALYFVPNTQISPARFPGSDNTNLVDYYRYTVNGRVYAIPPDRIIHFRYDLDPKNPMMGRRVLAPVFSEIFGDEKAARYVASLLRNLAVPGVAIIPEEDLDLSDEDAEAMKEQFKRKFGGDNVGEPWISNFRAKIVPVGFNPKQMELKELRRVPEERVSAVLGVAAIVAGLGAGLDRSTYSNFEQALRHSIESCLIPAWEEFGDEFSRQFLPEFERDENTVIRFDTSNVRGLRESADALFKRINSVWLTDMITRAEARAALGFVVDKGRDEAFYSQLRAPRVVPGIAPAPNGNGNGDEKGRLMRALLKAAPRKNLDRAFGYMLEAEVAGAIDTSQGEFLALFQDLGEAAEEAAAKGFDPAKPQQSADSIGKEAFQALADVVALLFLSLGERVQPGAIRAVSLTLGLTEGEVWGDKAAVRFAKMVTERGEAYGRELRAQTIEAAKEAVRLATEEGITDKTEIANRIRGMVEGRGLYPGKYQEAYDNAKRRGAGDYEAIAEGEVAAAKYRAELIAETEARTLQNVAALESLGEGGIERVKVTDGDGCGWKNHDDTDKAHNTTRDLREAVKYTLAHPRCKRRFYPVPADEAGE